MPKLRPGLVGKYIGYEEDLLRRVDGLRSHVLDTKGYRSDVDVFNYILRRGIEVIESEKKAPESK